MPQTNPSCSVPTLESTFRVKIEELWPLEIPRRAVLAVSGGADSTAMALLARNAVPDFFDRLAIAHFHHHMREEEAEEDARFVENFARQLDLPFVRGDWRPEELRSFHRVDRNLQAAARKARYAFLFDVARSQSSAVLFTAHHAR
ncbi:MAG: hypothetical protein KC978_24100, partial [Candidatus Omnitrophica bacterium]|nr:hypothetical protein [Candidatus Omnitrophota bacterium]